MLSQFIGHTKIISARHFSTRDTAPTQAAVSAQLEPTDRHVTQEDIEYCPLL
jgi:hypothetical protein